MEATRILAFVLVAIGAFVVYRAKDIFKYTKKQEPGEKELVFFKLIGLVAALAGMIILFNI